MFEFKTGNILVEDVEALVNTVNCVGVMGRGLALQFKKAYPDNFQAYAAACKRGEVKPGHLFLFKINHVTNPRFIINFPTKRHWRGKSTLEDIELGLKALAEVIREKNILSIAIPPLGCGLGGLDWREVRSRIVKVLQNLPECRIIIFEPRDAPTMESAGLDHVIPKMTPGRAALVGLMNRYLRGLLDPQVTLLEVHKLMYFMQEAGEKLRLKFKKAHYGPYAQNLRHVLNAIEGHFITGYADGGDMPNKQLRLIPGAVQSAHRFLQNHPRTCARFEKVAALVEGFESPFGLELLSTVHWIVKKETSACIHEVTRSVYAWNERKKQFSSRQINLAVSVLHGKGWIGRVSSP